MTAVHAVVSCRGVHDHAGQFFLDDEIESNRHLHGAGEQFFHALFAQGFAQAPLWCGVARPLVLEYSLLEKCCQVGVSPQRWITSLPLSLKACLRSSKVTINRVGRRERRLWRRRHRQRQIESSDHPDSDYQHSFGLWVFCRCDLLNLILINVYHLMLDDLGFFGHLIEFVVELNRNKNFF